MGASLYKTLIPSNASVATCRRWKNDFITAFSARSQELREMMNGKSGPVAWRINRPQ